MTNKTRKVMSFILLFALILSSINVATFQYSYGDNNVSLSVKKSSDVDVVLALGDSTQDVSNFSTDLKQKLIEKGIDEKKINIQSIIASEQNVFLGKFSMNIWWPANGTDMDSHIEFWSRTSKVDELYYARTQVYGSTLDRDDTNGGVGEWLTINFETIPANIEELRFYVNPYRGTTNTTMKFIKEVDGEIEEIINTTQFVNRKVYFGKLQRNEDAWDFVYSNGTVYSGKKVTVSSKKFTEVLREPEWRDSANHFIINLDESNVLGLDSNHTDFPEILTRMGNEEIHYIGWGSNHNKTQAEGFIEKNSDKGAFVNMQDTGRTYESDIDKMADYIYAQYLETVENNITYLVYGTPFTLDVTPIEEIVNTADESWPQGKWKVEHTADVFENHLGTVRYHNQYLNDMDIRFEKPGQYDIYYEGGFVNTIYVHRKPVSSFVLNVDENGEISILDHSYDPDGQNKENKGIVSRTWSYKEVADSAWHEGQPTSFEPNKDYVVQLKVVDEQGASSVSYSRYTSTTTSGPSTPISEFTIDPTTIIKGSDSSIITVNETSYDPRGKAIVDRQWTVKKDTTTIYNASNAPMTDFAAQGEGTYKISLRVKNSDGAAGTWSEVFTRTLKIIVDGQEPQVAVNNEGDIKGVSGTYDVYPEKNLVLNYSDEGDSGFAYQRYAITNSNSEPADARWSSYSNNLSRTIRLNEPGIWYVHYEAIDQAGNLLKGYYGPYTIRNISAPANPLVDDRENTVGWTWTPGYTNISYYEYSVDGGETWTNATANPQGGFIGDIDSGKVQIRVKSDLASGRPAGDSLVINAVFSDNPPVLSPSTVIGTEDEDVNFSEEDFKFVDAENKPLKEIKFMTLPSQGYLMHGGDRVQQFDVIPYEDIAGITFSPNPDWNGKTSFIWNGSDGKSYAESGATITIDIEAVNDAPVAHHRSFLINVFDTFIGYLLGTDVDGDALTYEIKNINQIPYGIFDFNEITGEFTYTVTEDVYRVGDVTVDYRVYDGKLHSNWAKLQLNLYENIAELTDIEVESLRPINFDVNKLDYNLGTVDYDVNKLTVTASVYKYTELIAGQDWTGDTKVAIAVNKIPDPLDSIKTVDGEPEPDRSYGEGDEIRFILDGGYYDINDPMDPTITKELLLEVGENKIYIVVECIDSDYQKIYTLHVTRKPSSDASLKTLKIDGEEVEIGSNILYDVEQIISSIPIEFDLGNADATVEIQLNGRPFTGDFSSIPLRTGENTIKITVTAQDGVTKEDYILRVNRDFNLSDIELNNGNLDMDFQEDMFEYELDIDRNEESIVVLPKIDTNYSSIKINGKDINSEGDHSAVNLNEGEVIITVEVIAEDGESQKRYEITVFKNYEVIFKDHNGDILKVQTVRYKTEATEPEIAPTREGYHFIGWDQELDEVTGDMVIIAQYEMTEEKKAQLDKEALTIGYGEGNSNTMVTKDIVLPTEGSNGSTISWASSPSGIISSNGKVTLPENNTTVTLTATIRNGDATETKTFVVRVVSDPEPPVITLKGDAVVNLEQGQLYVEKGFTSIDNKDGDITSRVTVEGIVNTNRAGTYTLIYRVKDNGDNETVITRTIIVKAKPFSNEATINAGNEEKIDDQKVADAIQGAKQKNENAIKILVDNTVTPGNSVKVNISKEQVESAKNNNLNLILESKNASIEVPIQALNTGSMGANSRLELVIELVSANEEMEEALESINETLGIYESHVYDFKMVEVQVDSEGNETSRKTIDFTSEEDITLTISIGSDKKETFMTFYYNESSKRWEYIRSRYNKATGEIQLLTNHLSIYSVTNLSKEEKLNELTKLINDSQTIEEVLNILEDEDLDYAERSNYNDLSHHQKEDIADIIVTEKPGGGYSGYRGTDGLENKLNSAVYELITGDSVAPVLTLNGKSHITISLGGQYVESGVSATDNKEGDISGRVTVYGEVDTTKTGEYIIRYVVRDLAGNESFIERTVTVVRPSSGGGSDKEPKPTTPADKTEHGIDILENQDNTQVDMIPSTNIKPNEKEMKIIGNAYEVKISVTDSKDIKSKISIQYDESLVTNEDHLSVFIYDQGTNTLKSIGGIVDKDKNTITIELSESATIVVVEYTKTFNDLDGHWAREIIEILAARQIIDGDGNGNFNPNMGITRAEFATLITKTLGLEIESASAGFEDVTAMDWYAPYIATARKAGIVKGVSETMYEPNRIVNRQEMTAMVLRAYRTVEEINVATNELDAVNQFADHTAIGDWAKEDVYTAKHLSLIKGRTEELFVPTSETLRGEAAVLIYRFLQALDRI